MANSSVDICNLAGDLLDIEPIASIENPTNYTEELFARWYDIVRQECLRSHPWNFARKRVQLAADSSDPVFGYNAQFTLPSDFLKVVYVHGDVTDNDFPVQAGSYTIEGGKMLIGDLNFSSTETLNLVYISDFETVPQMDGLFKDYFATKLAARIAYKATQSNASVERVNVLMQDLEMRARAMDGQDNPPKRIQRSRALSARRTKGSVTNYGNHILFR